MTRAGPCRAGLSARRGQQHKAARADEVRALPALLARAIWAWLVEPRSSFAPHAGMAGAKVFDDELACQEDKNHRARAGRASRLSGSRRALGHEGDGQRSRRACVRRVEHARRRSSITYIVCWPPSSKSVIRRHRHSESASRMTWRAPYGLPSSRARAPLARMGQIVPRSPSPNVRRAPWGAETPSFTAHAAHDYIDTK